MNLAKAESPLGEPLMTDNELAVFVSAFESSGFTSSINWYRNFDRNWHLLAEVNPVIQQPALMIYGERDAVPRSEHPDNVRAQGRIGHSGLRPLDPARKAGGSKSGNLEMAGAEKHLGPG